MKRKHIFIGFLLTGAVSMLIMSLHYFSTDATGILQGKALKHTLWYRIIFLIHISFGLLAILSGPFQFMNRLIQKKNLHKKLGYLYTLSVASSGFSGLVIAQFAMGGMITHVGFSVLAVIWLYSLYIGIKSAISGDIPAHQNWMRINYALTFSSVTLRTLLAFALIPGLSFIFVYQCAAWLCWIINLVIVISFVNRREKVKVHDLESALT